MSKLKKYIKSIKNKLQEDKIKALENGDLDKSNMINFNLSFVEEIENICDERGRY